ncbi:MAG: hypothetical protein EAZ65_04095 [Verrucomicrobia bacterium]|nr:MAG: hypothetical protein EAZ84_02525 [Verrucomicrobiota bacterium]TAE88549.1 MAG: hypothetical protein EAZ82_04775 [Verrucomicrobiota bacterium]TAF27004.1 MAG: hypothetical protein EAZ71_04090 [Verrucomicrobiota bacterium]TAF42260.1 MAG: hypothetical protein EAZ65_04095 [Verrucomicrobiota bacterium]
MRLLIALAVFTAAGLAQAQVLVNQSGYNTIGSKRFTAPLAAAGTPFSVVTDPAGDVVFGGALEASGDGSVGDFSAFQPAATGNYRIVLATTPAPQQSHVFGIGPFWIERVSYRRMLQFFIDSRSGFGDATSWNVAGGKNSSGIAWRDSHQFSFELRTLIQWYAANPDAFGPDRMPLEGSYLGLRDTLPADTPEIVRLIHWGVDIYLRGNLNHTLIKEELAYFLYYYPLLQPWIPISLYHEARDYLFPLWTNTARDRWNWYDITHTADLLQTYSVMGGTKGSLPPGHSIVPNLLMHQVALREGRGDAALYLTAARNQAQWIVNNLDPANPLVTKGQRMSEHILVPALAELMLRDPATPVTGIDAWLANWTDTVIARSANLWDFRKYSDTIWTPENVPGGHPWWNEPGNIAGFPASALAAATRITDPAKAARLRQIATSQLDQVFGRNPHNRHFCFRATQPTHGFEGVESGWFSQHIGGLGILENARGVLDASAKHLSFPYNPNVSPGYVEGWVAFNSAWNAGMTWAARDRSSIAFLANGATDGTVQVELTAPLNFNRALAETATVRLTSPTGDAESLTLTESGPDTSVFRGQMVLENSGTSAPGDSSLEAPAGTALSASYAHDIFARSATTTAADTSLAPLVIVTTSLPVARVGSAYPPLALTSAHGDGAPQWQILSGSLPAGMELSAAGILQGTPTAAGTFTPVFRVQDGAEQADKALTLACSGLRITTIVLGDAASGQAYQQTLLTADGLGAVTWSLAAASTLPAGLTLDPAGQLSGTPSAAGTYAFSLTATDSSGANSTSAYQLLVLGTPSGVIFTDTFDSGTGAWFKAAPVAGDSLSNKSGALVWTENGNSMSESIGRSFPALTLEVGQTLRLSFDYRQTGTQPATHIVRAGLYQLATPIADHNWAGANAVGTWKGYGTFVRDNSTQTNVARVESGSSTSGSTGPNNGTAGAYTDIGSKITSYDLADDGSVTYRFVFDATLVSPTRMDTLLTVTSGSGPSALTHFSIPGSQTSGSVHTGFNTVVLKQAGGTAMPATYDNLQVELIGGLNPAFFADWQELTWPGVGDSNIIGLDADPDGDGRGNFLEWALRLDATAPDPFQPGLVRDGDFLLFTYPRRKTALGEATFTVEWSDTLGNDWTDLDVVNAPPNPIDATRESVTASIPAGTVGRRFVRVRVSSSGESPQS